MRLGLGNTLAHKGLSGSDGLSLDLNFAVDKSLTARKGPTPVFTRSNATATFIGSDGLIQTAGQDIARFDHDPFTFVCKGLLMEEARTNLVFPSAALTTQTVTVTAVAHTLSFYGTGSVVLSGVATTTVTGTGAYPTRTIFTFTPTAGSLILTVTGSVTQAQLEAGGFVTSYIPTTTVSVTRSVDRCSITSTSFSGFYNQSEGTFNVSSTKNTPALNAFVIDANDNSFSNEVDLRYSSLSSVGSLINVVTTQVSLGGTNTSGAILKQALAYKLNDSAYSQNGDATLTDTVCLIPTVNRLDIGTAHNGNQNLNGHILYLRYYKKRLSNSKLQTLSAPAYTLGWSEPAVLLSSTNDSLVSTEGVLKEARRYGFPAGPLVVGGVTFTHSSLGTPFQDDAFFSAVGSSTGAMQSLLRNLSYNIGNGNAILLTSFEVGKTYMLQWFFADERTTDPTIQTRTQTITIAGYSKTFPAQLLGKTMKCYFVAPITDLTLFVGTVGEPESGHIEAFQIRKLD